MSCWKIQILDSFPVPSRWLEDGRLYLDTDESTDTRLSRRLDQITDIDEILGEKILPFDIPLTPRNLYILRNYIDPNILDPEFVYIRVRIVGGALPVNQVNLYVTEDSMPDQRISVEIRSDEVNPIALAERYHLNQIEFDEFEIDWQTVLDNWENESSYEPGGKGYYMLLANFGKFLYDTILKPSPIDTRFIFHVKKLLEDGFCNIGWKFESPFLETTVGKRIATYIGKPDYGDDPSVHPNREFSARVEQEDYSVPDEYRDVWKQWTILWTEDFDPGNVFQTAPGLFSGIGEYNFRLQGEVRMSFRNPVEPAPGSNGPGFIYNGAHWGVRISTITSLGGVISLAEFTQHGITSDGEVNIFPFDLLVENYLVSPGNLIMVEVYSDNTINFNPTKVDFDFTFFNEAIRTYYSLGDSVFPEDTIHPDYTLLDLLKGVRGLIMGKLDIDYINNTITLLPTEKGEFFEEEVEGYFKDNPITYDLRDGQIVDSEKTITPNREVDRYQLLRFKRGNDASIQELDLDDDNPLWSRKIDLGPQYKENTRNIENPFFEPTINKTQGFRRNDGFGFSFVDIPRLTDNLDFKLSTKIGPRIFIIHGLEAGATRILPDGNQIPGTIPWNDDQLSSYPYVAQYPNFRDSNLEKLPHLIYGYEDDDLYNAFVKRAIAMLVDNTSIEILYQLSQADFRSMSFREIFLFRSKGKAVFGRLIEMRDFDPCSTITTPMLLRPDKQTTDACLDDQDETEILNCNNAPTLNVSQVDNCYNFSTGGSFEQNPVEIVIEWRYASQSTWTEATQLCDPSEPFYVRAIFRYSEDSMCPEQIETQYIDPCGNNNPILTLEYDIDTETLLIMIEGQIESELDLANTEITYTIDGGSPTTINGNSVSLDISEGEVCAEATVVYLDGCPSDDIDEICITIPLSPPDCDQNTPDVACEEIIPGQGVFTFIRSGVVQDPVLIDQIQYRNIGEDLWKTWDEHTVLECPFEYRRVVIWCQDICPPFCSMIHTCNCECVQFMPGSPTNIAVCN